MKAKMSQFLALRSSTENGLPAAVPLNNGPVQDSQTAKANSQVSSLLLPGLLLCITTIFGACTSGEPNTRASAPGAANLPKTAFPMPPVSGKSLTAMGWSLSNGKRGTFGGAQGKVLILDFYATWCEPCRISVPHLIDLQSRHASDLRIVGLNVGGPDDIERVPDFARTFNITYQLGLPDDELVRLLLSDIDAIPQTFVFDRQGQLTKRFVGFDQTTVEEIDRAVDDALKSTAPQDTK